MAKAKPADGVLRDGYVFVDDEAQANRLYNRSFIGEPQPGNTLRLSLVEAAWANAGGRLAIRAGATDLTHADIASERDVATAFLVYCDLRERGLVVRHAGKALAVWPRGKGIETPPDYLVTPTDGAAASTGGQLAQAAATGLVFGVVDADGVVGYYRTTLETPHGEWPAPTLPPIPGRPFGGMVLIADEESAKRCAQAQIGTTTPAGIVLSSAEAEALRRRGLLTATGDLATAARPLDGRFDGVVGTLLALQDAGVAVKSGFKFGTHLRAYRGNPETTHADWLVQCVTAADTVPWDRLAQGVRLAHGVRKKIMFSISDGAAVSFVTLAWLKP